jgi:hypothetical protein
MPTLRATRRGIVGFWIASVGAVVAIAVVVALIVTWPHHGDSSTRTDAVNPAVAKQGEKAAASATAPRSAVARP